MLPQANKSWYWSEKNLEFAFILNQFGVPMSRRLKNAQLQTLTLDSDGKVALHQQLFLALRQAILDGRLKPDTRLPSSRSLAADLNISRNTVLSAYDQLTAEGYLVSRIGAGSFVSDQLPDDLLQRKTDGAHPDLRERDIYLSKMAAPFKGKVLRPANRGLPFSPGLPALEVFPFDDWARLLARHWRRPAREYLVDNPIGGTKALREAVASHLGQTRAVRCHADQVIILSGSQQAIHLVVRAFAEPGDAIWMEEPGYPGIRDSILAAGATPVSIPVDEEGFSLALAREIAPDARLACISPSHQYPLGQTMSLARRLDLLKWAKEEGRFILEDDYDSEYRYAGRPLSSLQGLDDDNRVLYVGTMSKVMFSGLRVGYMVVPEDLVDVFLSLRRIIDNHSPAVPEAALADFINEGYLAAHVRRTRLLYEQRQKRLVTLLEDKLGDIVTVTGQESGMHLVAFLPPHIRDTEIERAAAESGMLVRALSGFYNLPTDQTGLILGFAGTREEEMPHLVDKLAAIIRARAK
ncbi:aminotransferase class I/II-fold pyridoxal phosphate-dependent enzyme [Sneathiella chungangensis]|uniref:Aminotransferase class I/II-fold pyridoxal phosphate-dependent enzyme n=2 Tax=Sneathiella chungangensis TaxID=1418234 RepID=A0A845MKC4_9PROT|nr:aminotransferase class I/II-fold pyridoxal phosphate-dependent enzyme [Sneathiella chungangensis]